MLWVLALDPVPRAACDIGRAERGARDQWEAAGSVVPIAGEKPHAARIAAHEHPEAVVFDLVQPPSPSRRLRGWAVGRAHRGRLRDATQAIKAARRDRSRVRAADMLLG
jgi:hypothetical protein